MYGRTITDINVGVIDENEDVEDWYVDETLMLKLLSIALLMLTKMRMTLIVMTLIMMALVITLTMTLC